jgi:hypothetical protein
VCVHHAVWETPCAKFSREETRSLVTNKRGVKKESGDSLL